MASELELEAGSCSGIGTGTGMGGGRDAVAKINRVGRGEGGGGANVLLNFGAGGHPISGVKRFCTIAERFRCELPAGAALSHGRQSHDATAARGGGARRGQSGRTPRA